MGKTQETRAAEKRATGAAAPAAPVTVNILPGFSVVGVFPWIKRTGRMRITRIKSPFLLAVVIGELFPVGQYAFGVSQQ